MADGGSFDIGLVAGSSYDEKGFLHIQPDGCGEKAAGIAPYEAQAMCGELARPMDPDLDSNGLPIPSKACQVAYSSEGGGHAFCLNDPRTLSKLPQLRKGEKVVFAPNMLAQFIRFHESGAISLYTTHDGTPDGQPIIRSMSPDPLDGIQDVCPWGNVSFNSTGYHLVTAGGATLDGGGMSIPGLPSALGSYWTLTAATIDLVASVVCLGPLPESALPVALSTPALLLIGLQQQQIAALCAAVASLLPVSGTTTVQVAAVAAALEAFVASSPALIDAVCPTSTNSN